MLVGFADFKPDDDKSGDKNRTSTSLFWLGNIFAVLSTIFYSSFIVINQRRYSRGIQRQNAWLELMNPREKPLNKLVKKQPEFAMVLALSGVFCLFLCWLPLPILHVTGVEPIPCEIYHDPRHCTNFSGPSIPVWAGLTSSAVISTVAGEFLWIT
ncbi:hypothetical protein Ciccas_010915, partial [Cichlidogyrus casuarinus]